MSERMRKILKEQNCIMRAENMNFFDDLKNNFKQKLNEAVD